MKLFCNTTFDATKSLITDQYVNNLASVPTLYFEDKLQVEIVFVKENGEIADFVGQAGNIITIAVGNLAAGQILTQSVLDEDGKTILDLSTAPMFGAMYNKESANFEFEIQICFSTGKTQTLCQQNCQIKNQILGTEITPPLLEKPNPPQDINVGYYPAKPSAVTAIFAPSQFTINPVVWTNISEINLGGEKLTNADFNLITKTSFPGTPTVGMQVEILRESIDPNYWANPSKNPYTVTNVTSNGIDVVASDGTGGYLGYDKRKGTNPNFWETYIYELDNWSVNSAITLDQEKLSQGIIKGDGGAVSIQQTFNTPIESGVQLIVQVIRADNNEDGEVRVQTLRANGTPYGTIKDIPYGDGFVEFETTETTYGLRLSTAHGTREVSAISLFQGVISGGSVQISPGSIEKISGNNGWNAGASSTNYITGNEDGYLQFQWNGGTKSAMIGLTYEDNSFGHMLPYNLKIYGNDRVETTGTNKFVQDNFALDGTFFRIRHNAQSNQIYFQRKEGIYHADATLRPADYVITDNSDLDQYVVFLTTSNLGNQNGTDYKVTLFRGYKIVGYSIADNNLKIIDDGGLNTWLKLDNTSPRSRGQEWEFATNIGEDFLTFHTHSQLTTGQNLYADTSFYHVGARFNDVLLAR